jgi:hypothetical protein
MLARVASWALARQRPGTRRVAQLGQRPGSFLLKTVDDSAADFRRFLLGLVEFDQTRGQVA